jgi:hypothetical protein
MLFPGVYLSADVEVTPEVLAQAVSLVLPEGAAVGGVTGALLHGADVRRLGDAAVDVVLAREDQVRRRGVRSRAALLEPGDVVEMFAREVQIHAEPLSQSVMESIQRLRLVLAGLPRPRAQVPVRLADCTVARIDNGYEEWKVGAEYDGEVHEKTWRHDLERQETIRDQDWWHRRHTSLRIGPGWRRMVDQVGAALLTAGWRPAP